jgi:hypothetical protein
LLVLPREESEVFLSIIPRLLTCDVLATHENNSQCPKVSHAYDLMVFLGSGRRSGRRSARQHRTYSCSSLPSSGTGGTDTLCR